MPSAIDVTGVIAVVTGVQWIDEMETGCHDIVALFGNRQPGRVGRFLGDPGFDSGYWEGGSVWVSIFFLSGEPRSGCGRQIAEVVLAISFRGLGETSAPSGENALYIQTQSCDIRSPISYDF
jgi:hypothetical protein